GLRRALGLPVDTVGVGRIAARTKLPNVYPSAALHFQLFSNWTEIPELTIDAWLAKCLKQVTAYLSPATSGAIEFQIYSPESNSSRFHYLRWVQPANWKGTSAHLQLCRTSSSGPVRYFWARLERTDGEMKIIQEAPASTFDVRRLQFALDHRCRRPVHAI